MAKRDIPGFRRGGSREAIVDAAERLFLERGFGGASMDDLAEAAGVARRTLYNQFSGKEEIFREMVDRVSRGLGDAPPPGIETQGGVEEVLRLMARALLAFQARPEFIGLVRMVAADVRQFPWIAEESWSDVPPHEERFERYLAHLTAMGVLDCPDPRMATSQLLGLLNEPLLWPRVLGRDRVPPPDEVVVEEAVRLFLLRYRRLHAAGHRR